MKNLPRTTALLAASLLALPSAASAQAKKWQDVPVPALRSFDLPLPARHELGNGLVIFLMEDHELPLVDLTAMVRTGGRHVPAAKAGLDEIFGDTWRTGGTKSKTGDQLDDALEALAAEVESSMGSESARLRMNCLSQDFDTVLATFVDVLRNPAFTEDKIELAKHQVRTSISRRNDTPDGIVRREAAKLGYGADSPYARVPEYATVEAIARQDLVDWHAAHVQPDRTIVGVVGDFDSAKMLAKLTAALGSWPRGPKVELPEATYRKSPVPGVYFIEKEDVTQAQIVLVHLGIRRDDPDYHAVEVLDEILSGGFTSRLFNGIRSKRGLAYSVFGGVYAGFDHPGLTLMGMGTKNGNVAAGIDAFYEELDGILGAVPVTDQELRVAKDSILNSFVFKVDSREKVLNQQVTYAYYGYPADFLQRYQAGIEKVTKEDVMRVAKAHIHKEELALLVLGKSSEFDRPLTSFGTVTPVDVTIPVPGAEPPAPATPETSAKGSEGLDRLVEGFGGKEKVAGLKDFVMSGRLVIRTPVNQMLSDVKSTVVIGGAMRQEVNLAGQKMTIVVTPTDAYALAGPSKQPIAPTRREEMNTERRRNPLFIAVAAVEGKATATHVGKEKVGEVEADVYAVDNQGTRSKLYLDEKGRAIRVTYMGVGPDGPNEMANEYTDFHDVSGMAIAFSINTTRGGQLAQGMIVKEFQVNTGVDPASLEAP